MEIRFTKPLQRRKSFIAWQIPKKVRSQNDIKDRDVFMVTVFIGGKPIVLKAKVTSGGEISLKTKIANKIKSYANKHPDGAIDFGLLDEAASARLSFEETVINSLKLNPAERNARLRAAHRIPKKRLVSTWVFDRNPDVVAHALVRANGRCECCKSQAPFVRQINGTPYLEVHHRVPLAEGGDDTIENAIALCPNCHREAHFGPR